MKIAVLGSGPSGILAAEACRQMEHDVDIFSKTRKPSPMNGSQYIHESLPGITPFEPSGEVTFHKIGDARGYASKVYGSPDAPTSWDIFPTGSFPCWNLAHIYKRLHKRYVDDLLEVDIDGQWIDDLLRVRMYDLIISAIPAKVLCKNPLHRFPYVDVIFESHEHQDSNLGQHYIYYNGLAEDPWYRSSFIFGRGFWEYGAHNLPFAFKLRNGAYFGIKPLDTDCDCRPNIVRVGRFGEWKKGVLVHDAFRKTIDALEVRTDASLF